MFFDVDQIIKFVKKQGWVLGRVTWRPPTHVFRNGKSLCGIWRLGIRVIRIIPGTEKPLCRRCIRSVQYEHNKKRDG